MLIFVHGDRCLAPSVTVLRKTITEIELRGGKRSRNKRPDPIRFFEIGIEPAERDISGVIIAIQKIAGRASEIKTDCSIQRFYTPVATSTAKFRLCGVFILKLLCCNFF